MPGATNCRPIRGSIVAQPTSAMKKNLLMPSALGLLGLMIAAGNASARGQAAPPKEKSPTMADQAAQTATQVKDAVAEKMTAWKLTPDDIKDDFAKTGRIVRTKAATIGQRIGETIDDARIVTVVKGKYFQEKNLSAFGIGVSCDQGAVTLTGSVKSLDLIGRAAALALDTNGVTSVTSLLRVDS
jgi:osmotically-inducible protein OsmY